MFFDIFKLCFSKTKTNKNNINCLWANGKAMFISTAFQTFCQKQKIKIRYIVLYIHEKKQYSRIILKNASTNKRLTIYQ